MPDSVTSRGRAAANLATAGPRRKSAGGQPLRTKAEKRAEAKAAKARARAMRKRRQALAVGGAAVVVLALVVGLIVWVSRSSSQPSAAAPSAAASASPSAAESAAAFPPVPTGADPALSKKPAVTAGTGTVSKLRTTTLIKGTGAAVQSGQTVNVNYVGVNYADGKEFDSSWSRSEAFSFQVGAGSVIKGWDQGLIGVKVGSRVRLDIPADLAYGEKPSGGQPAGTLRFVVDVLSAS
ncbi:FKBP-type peptidyl-prolyl cis-trans isomerase [Actinoplanes sp. ATCC 53533]|uniref:FKBP-type peptidyl-prolyl cis-trans isomerase n=1 Tax=Actinoplanes sp. ATCC 53533 TaxID=1288362 RepID=UPI001F44C0ED|nr:FKBP-type peptidyl-prolyl cis-trans isomerase [Actinoplanes sp. ATCC 53533]